MRKVGRGVRPQLTRGWKRKTTHKRDLVAAAVDAGEGATVTDGTKVQRVAAPVRRRAVVLCRSRSEKGEGHTELHDRSAKASRKSLDASRRRREARLAGALVYGSTCRHERFTSEDENEF